LGLVWIVVEIRGTFLADLWRIGYRFNAWLSAQVSYRYQLEDFDDEGFVYDVALHGALVEF
jgi:hypothetical protein